MSWLFSAALVEAFSEATSSDGAPSALSNGNHTPQAYCAPDKMTAFSRLSRFGMTYAPLTADRGEALCKSYRAVFRARTSAQRGGAGIDGERSGMWREMARIIHEVQPRFAFVENSPMLTSRGLGTVLGDLAAMGFDAKWGVLGAADVGANHQRDRIWIVGNSSQMRLQGDNWNSKFRITKETIQQFDWWRGDWDDLPKPYYIRSNDGVAARVDRLKAIGNGQVPLCAATAWQLLTGEMK